MTLRALLDRPVAGRMTSAALRAKLDRLGLSQTAAAELVGVNPRTMRSWCAEPQRSPVPATAERLLDLMERCPDAWRSVRENA